LHKNPCFFRVRESNSQKNQNFWMVDPSIDPRERKVKFEWTPIPYQEKLLEANIANSLGLAVDDNRPPSATTSEVVNSLNLRPSSGEAMMLEYKQALRDLKDIDTFYRERAEK
jgi:hypothetical protein